MGCDSPLILVSLSDFSGRLKVVNPSICMEICEREIVIQPVLLYIMFLMAINYRTCRITSVTSYVSVHWLKYSSIMCPELLLPKLKLCYFFWLQVRKGVLPRLLEEILTTRIMVKKSMKKLTESEKILYRVNCSNRLLFYWCHENECVSVSLVPVTKNSP